MNENNKSSYFDLGGVSVELMEKGGKLMLVLSGAVTPVSEDLDDTVLEIVTSEDGSPYMRLADREESLELMADRVSMLH